MMERGMRKRKMVGHRWRKRKVGDNGTISKHLSNPALKQKVELSVFYFL